MSKTITFYYDVVCPYSYIAATRIEEVARRNNADIVWKPVLLGGIYKLTKAPQGKDGSATDVMALSKQIIGAKDLKRQIIRFNIPFQDSTKHPQRTIKAQRLLCSVAADKRPSLSHALYQAYWVKDQDLTINDVLQEAARSVGVHVEAYLLNEAPEKAKEMLEQNTKEVVAKGGFGVPTFWVNNGSEERMFFGADRLHFVEKFLGNPNAQQPRLFSSISPARTKTPKLTFYYDFSSPWSYIGSTQIEAVAKATQCTVEYVPILLGALFKEIGTPMVPMAVLIEPKRNYGMLDMQDWLKWYNIKLNWPTAFPIRTVLPLRVAIVEPKLINPLYKAAWVDNINIGDEKELRTLLDQLGYNSTELIDKANQDSIKDQLRQNNIRAKATGCCGVPSFQINNGEVIWGQDRLDIVMDMLCGWECPLIEIPLRSKL